MTCHQSHQDAQEPAGTPREDSAHPLPVQCCACGAWRCGALWLDLASTIRPLVVVIEADGTNHTQAVSHTYCPTCETKARDAAMRYLESRGLKAVIDE